VPAEPQPHRGEDPRRDAGPDENAEIGGDAGEPWDLHGEAGAEQQHGDGGRSGARGAQ
jgi:hypothetical protein